jgi:hypothetical protein
MTAHPGKTAGSGRARRKAASGLAGVGSAAAIVGAGIAALATGSTPLAAPEGQPQALTATLTADQPLIPPPVVSPTSPVNPSVALPNSVAFAGGGRVSVPLGGGSNGNDTFVNVSGFLTGTSPGTIFDQKSGGSLSGVASASVANNGTVSSPLIPSGNTGGPTLPPPAANSFLDPPLPTVAQSLAQMYAPIESNLSQAFQQQQAQQYQTALNNFVSSLDSTQKLLGGSAAGQPASFDPAFNPANFSSGPFSSFFPPAAQSGLSLGQPAAFDPFNPATFSPASPFFLPSAAIQSAQAFDAAPPAAAPLNLVGLPLAGQGFLPGDPASSLAGGTAPGQLQPFGLNGIGAFAGPGAVTSPGAADAVNPGQFNNGSPLFGPPLPGLPAGFPGLTGLGARSDAGTPAPNPSQQLASDAGQGGAAAVTSGATRAVVQDGPVVTDASSAGGAAVQGGAAVADAGAAVGAVQGGAVMADAGAVSSADQADAAAAAAASAAAQAAAATPVVVADAAPVVPAAPVEQVVLNTGFGDSGFG